MKADVQYNDLKGTIAADITDLGAQTNNLSEIVDSYINVQEYNVIGLKYYNGYNGYKGEYNTLDISILLEDKISKKIFSKEITITVKDFFAFFKRLSFVLIDRDFPHEHITNYQIQSLNDE